MHFLAMPAALIGRILLSLLFIMAGFNKLTSLAATNGYFESLGLPAGMALPVGLFEAIGGLLLLIGFLTRPLALAFAVFTVLTAVLGHNQLSDPMQLSIFMKNLAIAGGFLLLFAYGNMAYSFDSVRNKRRHDREVHNEEMSKAQAKARAREAEARADARKPTVTTEKKL